MEDSFEDKVYREYILETIDDVQLNKLFTEFERAIEKWEEVHSNENFLTLLNTANAFFRAHIAMSGKMDACAMHIFCIYRRVLTGIDSMETFFTLKDEAKERGFENHALFCNFMPGTDMVAEKRSVLTSDDLLSWVLANKKINALWERMEGCLIDWRDRYGVFTHEEYFDLIMSFKDDLKNDGSKIDECLDCLFAFNDASKANLKELLRVFGLDEMTAHLTHTLFEYRQSFSGVTEEECAKLNNLCVVSHLLTEGNMAALAHWACDNEELNRRYQNIEDLVMECRQTEPDLDVVLDAWKDFSGLWYKTFFGTFDVLFAAFTAYRESRSTVRSQEVKKLVSMLVDNQMLTDVEIR